MLRFFYGAKTRIVFSTVIALLVIALLIQGVIGIFYAYESKNSSGEMTALIIDNDASNLSALLNRVDSLINLIESDSEYLFTPAHTVTYDLIPDSRTFNAMNIGAIDDNNVNTISPEKSFAINDINIVPFSISHDAANPVCFSFYLDEGKFSSLTDTGVITQDIYNHVCDSKYLLLESNHDVDMLQFGNYPFQLKKRILGKTGHLSNLTAAKMAAKMMENGTEHIMLGHLSNENNTPEIAYKTTENILVEQGGIIGKDITLSVAKRYEITRLI